MTRCPVCGVVSEGMVLHEGVHAPGAIDQRDGFGMCSAPKEKNEPLSLGDELHYELEGVYQDINDEVCKGTLRRVQAKLAEHFAASATQRSDVRDSLERARLMTSGLRAQLSGLLERYAKPCLDDCQHAHCPILRELHDMLHARAVVDGRGATEGKDG